MLVEISLIQVAYWDYPSRFGSRHSGIGRIRQTHASRRTRVCLTHRQCSDFPVFRRTLRLSLARATRVTEVGNFSFQKN